MSYTRRNARAIPPRPISDLPERIPTCENAMNLMQDSETWARISDRDFERVISWILQREGFFDISWRGADPDDPERAIACWRNTLLSDPIRTQECVVKCRKDEDDLVEIDMLQADILRITEHKPDNFILATPAKISASAREWAASAATQELGARVLLWGREDLGILFDHHQDLRFKFFNILPSATFFMPHLPDQEEADEFEYLFTRPVVRDAFARACTTALDQATLLTAAHLLSALIRVDEDCTRSILDEQGVDPNEIAKYLEQLAGRGQNKVDFAQTGLQTTMAFRSAVEVAIAIETLLGEYTITERALLLAVMMDSESVSVNTLNQLINPNEPVLLNSLLASHFTEKNVAALKRTFGEELRHPDVEALRSLWHLSPEDLNKTMELRLAFN